MDIGGHVHDPKVCADCKQEFPITNFPVWKSSCDGHRHTCLTCTKARNEKHAAAARDARQADREATNRLIKEHGYRWEPRITHGQRTFILRDPLGNAISKERALDAIYASLDEGDEPPW